RGDVYGRLIPASQLRGAAARIIDLRSDAEHRPRRRTFGTGLPGYAAGWFRLRNGEKALLFLTDWTHVVYVPKRAGYAVLMISRVAPARASHARPLPNRVAAALESCSLNLAKSPKLFLIASASTPLGAPPPALPAGAMMVQNSE